MTRKLQPPKNFRWTVARICATCRYLQTDADGGVMVCDRGVVVFDTGDRDDILRTCDGWRNGTIFGHDAVE
jgi:hypothetical protein